MQSSATKKKPVQKLFLNPDRFKHDQQYRRYAGQFLKHIADFTHEELNMERVFRPGFRGPPVRDRFPYVFWKAEKVSDTRAHGLAASIIPGLYSNAMRKTNYDPVEVEQDRLITVAIINFALWKGKDLWIYSLASHCDYAEIPFKEIYMISALIAAANNKTMADFYHRLAGSDDPYYNFCYRALSSTLSQLNDSNVSSDRLSEGFSVKRLLWLESAHDADNESEKYLIRKMTKNPPVDEDELMDLYSNLLNRGKLYRANRLLLRHCKFYGEKHGILNTVLRLYLLNGKYLLYLRRLAKMKIQPSNLNWFQAVFCIYRLELQKDKLRLLNEVFSNKPEQNLPDEIQSERFFLELDLGSEARFPTVRSTESPEFDLLLCNFLMNTTLNSRLIQERNQIFENLVLEPLNNHELADPERLQLFLRSVLWNFFQPGQEKVIEAMKPLMESLAGGNITARIFMGLANLIHGQYDFATLYLERAQNNHPVVNHARSIIYVSENDSDRAEKIYKNIVSQYPEELPILFHYGKILELNQKKEDARRIYQKILEENPDFQQVRDHYEGLDKNR